MESLGLRQGTWWAQQPDGKWMSWKSSKDQAGQWEPGSRPDPPECTCPDLPCKDVTTPRFVSVEDYSSADLVLLKSAVDQLRFVTTMFWQQANFFTVIQGALLSVVASQFLYRGSHKLPPLIFLSAVGLGLAVFWACVARKRVRIIDKWTDQVRHIDQEVDRHLAYERAHERRWYQKPTHITQVLPCLLALAWIALLILATLTKNPR